MKKLYIFTLLLYLTVLILCLVNPHKTALTFITANLSGFGIGWELHKILKE